MTYLTSSNLLIIKQKQFIKMKKLIFVFAVLFMGAMSAQAQDTAKKSCSKSCSKTCSKKASASADATATTQVASAFAEAEVAAKSNENIKVKECSTSGKKSFYEKSTCSTSGKVSWSEVEYCSKDKAFKKVAAASMERTADAPAKKSDKKACCSKKDGKKSCSKKASTK